MKAVLQDDLNLVGSLQDDVNISATLLTDTETFFMSYAEKAKSLVITAKNGTGLDQPAYQIWSWSDNNQVVLADADEIDLNDLAGINLSPVTTGSLFELVKFGRAQGALVGKSCVAGELLYLSATPGQLSKIAPTTGTKIIIGQAEPTSALDVGSANDLWIAPQLLG